MKTCSLLCFLIVGGLLADAAVAQTNREQSNNPAANRNAANRNAAQRNFAQRNFAQRNFAQRLVKRFDTNDDGRLDDAERQAGAAAMRQALGSNEQLIKRYDRNANGTLEPNERQFAMRAIQQLLAGSTNRPSDRKPSDRPARPARTNPSVNPAANPATANQEANRARMVRQFDENKNGRLDPEELAKLRARADRFPRGNRRGSLGTAPPRKNRVDQTELLARFDRNRNGRLDADERQAAVRELDKESPETR